MYMYIYIYIYIYTLLRGPPGRGHREPEFPCSPGRVCVAGLGGDGSGVGVSRIDAGRADPNTFSFAAPV